MTCLSVRVPVCACALSPGVYVFVGEDRQTRALHPVSTGWMTSVAAINHFGARSQWICTLREGLIV